MYCLDASDNQVRLWTDVRLSLSPVNEILTARQKLRAALSSLTPPPGAILSCSYISEREGFFDVENVLIYNVGTGPFAALSKSGLTFERRRVAPPPAPDGRMYAHLSEYRFVPTPAAPKHSDASISFVPGKLSDPFYIWWAATSVEAATHQAISTFPFSLFINLRLPVLPKNPSAVVKRLVDGIVASLNSDESPDADPVVRLAARHRVFAEEIAGRLRQPPNPWLRLASTTRLVRSYRQGVKWHPTDERCERCTFIVSQAPVPSCVVTVQPMTVPLRLVGELPNTCPPLAIRIRQTGKTGNPGRGMKRVPKQGLP